MSPNELSLPPKTRIGRYELLVPLGRGGMATVYLASTVGFGGFRREVAVKLSHPHLSAESDYRESLIREATIGSRIRHPNVVNVEDIGSVEEGVFLVMEYVEGLSLHALMKKVTERGEKFPVADALAIVVEALLGLHAAHELRDEEGTFLNLVHRDFSPHNILIGRDGRVRLTDFGIAKARLGISHTESGVVKGKLRYMAPEQVQGFPLDRRADLWAAGVILFELLAGEALFDPRKDESNAIFSIIMGPIANVSEKRDVPHELAALITKALERDPERRVKTADELQRDLSAILRGLPEPPSIAELVHRHAHEELAQRAERVSERRSKFLLSVEALTAAAVPSLPSDVPSGRVELLDESQGVPGPPRVTAKPWRRTLWIAGTLLGAVLLLLGIATQTSLFRRTPISGLLTSGAPSTVVSGDASSLGEVGPIPSVSSTSPSSISPVATQVTTPPPSHRSRASHPRPPPPARSGVPKLADDVYTKKP